MAAMTHRRASIWVAVLLLPAALMLSCDGDEPAARRKNAAPAIPKVAFKVGEIRAMDAFDRAESPQKAQEQAGKVVELLNSYYTIAFVDPAKWHGGAHPELANLFSPEVHGQMAPNLGALALADLVPKLTKLTPSKQEAPKLTFLLVADFSAPFASVTSIFEGMATAKLKAESPVKVTHTATFWLLREGDAYKVIGFKTNLVADTGTKSAEVIPSDWMMPG
jgi:hypothetical protein